jgi:DNA-binding SARP family transcriptional activator
MALLWPESDTARARHQLREALYRLRETLGDAAIVGSGDHVHLEPSLVRCDAWDFEAAVARNDWPEADRLYTGPLLDGFFLSGAPEFERWLDAQRARFLGMHRAALEAVAVECASRDEWPRAVSVWRRCVEADQYSSRAAVGLMTALAAVGDRAGALRHAAEYENLLKADLDAEPDAAVVALAEQMRRATAPTPVVSVSGPQPPSLRQAM